MPTYFGGNLLGLQLPVLMSSRDTLTDTPRNDVLSAMWTSLSPVKLTRKINYHVPELLASPSIAGSHACPASLLDATQPSV